jgi:hypothetical protein
MNSSEDDPLDAVLGSPPPAADEDLHRRVLADTLGVLRSRRRSRRGRFLAALLACYLAGAGTVGLLSRRVSLDRSAATASATADAASSMRTAPGLPGGAGSAVAQPSRTPRQSGTQQIASDKAKPAGPRRMSYQEICRVSDRALRERGDIQTAIRYYSSALRSASPEEREVSVQDDSWLLMALKKARSEETKHDRNG